MADVIDDSLSLCVCGCRFILRFRRESKLKSEAAYFFTQTVRPVGRRGAGWGGVGRGAVGWCLESSVDICFK